MQQEGGKILNQEKVGQFIAELRKEKGMTQVELGERIGVTNKTISRWETGSYMPDLSTLECLCRELDININELLIGERLNDQDFRREADLNIVSSLNREKSIWKRKKMIDFLEGGGTGILISALYSPDSARRTFAVIMGIVMIFIGWYGRENYEKYIISKIGP
ncbi:XRE family transcriptional regulator [Clostridium sp. AM58-1XD]|nr:XRE family transcriptional regulator [Clostridium sp. AM58-1XD]